MTGGTPPETEAPGTEASSVRGRLLAAASRLFYARGINATGIDAVIAEAGVAKQSLYNTFSSKDELTRAYVTARHEEWLELYRARVAQADCPRDRVLAVVDAYLDHASGTYEHGFRGCGLLNAAAEFPAGSPGREAVRRHKEQVQSLIAGHLAETGSADPELAEHLAFLLEGAMSRAGLEGRPDLLLSARRLAAGMLDPRPDARRDAR
ncbi:MULTISPECIES: TetR/AcrR family transcriptional regulator [Citricoccus]|uniref:TetR/AcrR family transcriptional regulator n=1 Tax=Citricoccus TaxID=169133 RepID=UPI000255E1A9|nr:TetR/AcrR family transcriptional regulator [Citricoccus sp. CH26A]